MVVGSYVLTNTNLRARTLVRDLLEALLGALEDATRSVVNSYLMGS